MKDPLPHSYSLDQNYPNASNPSTKIKYSIPQSSNIIIKVFDISGNDNETLVNEEKKQGHMNLPGMQGSCQVEFTSINVNLGTIQKQRKCCY